jgi:exopolysaccharide biosynthesis polyprenyl glycosylphosphotransferase
VLIMGSADAVLTTLDTTAASSPVEISVRAPGRLTASRRLGALTGLTVVTDLLAVLAAYVVSDAYAVASGHRLSGHISPAVFATGLLWPLAFAAYGLYDRRRLVAPSEEARRLFHGVAVGTIAVVLATAFLRQEVSRTWIASLFVAGLVLTSTSRIIVRRATRILQAHNVVGERVLVVGTNEEARTIARNLSRQQWLGYAPVGFVDTGNGSFGLIDNLPVAGTVEEVAEAVLVTDATAVIVAGTALTPGELPALCARLQALDVDIRVSAGLGQVAASRITVEPLDGVAVLSVRRNQLTNRQAFLKRLVDVFASVTLLTLLAPLMGAIALAVKLSSKGKVIFSQIRVGESGRPFTIYKFRTMVCDAEQRLVDLRDHNEADGVLFKMKLDPRTTSVGRILRPLGLDELPQLWNVLKGEMSLVGPRPPLPNESARYDEWVAGRLKVKPGITGLWQVNGRHELSYADYVRYDLFYVENWSLIMDLYVLAKTVPAVLNRKGAS